MIGYQTQHADSSVGDIVQQLRTRYALALLSFILIISIVATLLGRMPIEFPRSIFVTQLAPIFIPVFIALIVLYQGDQGRQFINDLAAALLVLTLFTVDSVLPTFPLYFMITAFTIAILATSTRLFNTFLLIVFMRYITAVTLNLAPVFNAETTFSTIELGVIVSGLIPIVVSVALHLFINQIEEATLAARRSATLLEASADIGQSMSQLLELNQLLTKAVEIIRDRFAFYHVQVFLVEDDGDYAHLRASTGQVGEQMLARQHRLRIDTSSVVGRATQAGEPIIARDTDRDETHAANELLPDTRSELGIPIKDSEGVIGALDVQSRRPDAFNEIEIRVLQVIANQLATAIRNARLFESQAHNLRENKRLFIESETSLREIQRLNRQLTRQAWEDYLDADRRVDGVTLSTQGFDNRSEWTEAMLEASQRRRAVQAAADEGKTVAVPIELRGEVVGAIEIEIDGQQSQDDVMDMVQAISQRLAVSLDNARLFEEAHEATAQEERISELVSRYQTADSVDDLLKITLTGLAETLGADAGSIRIRTQPDGQTADRSNGHAASNGSHSSNGDAIS